MSPAFVRTGTRLAVLEMIQSGTTTYADMYYFEEEIAEVTKAAGLRGVLGQTIIQFPVADAKTPADGAGPGRRLHRAVQGRPADRPGRGAACALHARPGDADRRPRSRDQGAACRSSSTSPRPRDEVKVAKERGAGQSPRATSSRSGSWPARRRWPRTACGCRRRTSPSCKQRGVGVSHNPESNMKLASGTAPVLGYLQAGVALGLGTDGAASNNDLDMFEAMRQAAFLHKLQQRRSPSASAAQTALEMATLGGARALGMAEPHRLARSRQARRPHRRVAWTRRGRRRSTTRSRTWSTRPGATTSTPPSSTGRS